MVSQELNNYGLEFANDIKDESVLTVSFARKRNVKEVIGIIRCALNKAGKRKEKMIGLFFGETEWKEHEEKKSTHYHIAIVSEITQEQKRYIQQEFEYQAGNASLGDKSIICRWGCNHSKNYLFSGHALPFKKRF